MNLIFRNKIIVFSLDHLNQKIKQNNQNTTETSKQQSMSSQPQLGGPNNPANKRKLIESEVDAKQMIIIDNGTQSIKIGYSGSDYPSVIIDTVAGYATAHSENDATPPKRVYFGKQLSHIVETKKYQIDYAYPIVDSYIPQKSMDDMIDLWDYALTEVMGVDKLNANILIIDSPANSKQYKAKLTLALFEKLKSPSVLFMNSSVLSLFSVGTTIGLVTEIGHGTTTCVPVFEGFILNHALQHSKIGGKAITSILQQQLTKQKIKFQANDPLTYASIVKGIKQKNVKVAYDYEHEIQNDDRTEQQKCYELPDGSVIQLSKQTVYRPGQILFDPRLIGPDSPISWLRNGKTLPQMINTSLNRCNEDLKSELCKNMVFCGGSSLIHGMEDRVGKEMSKYGDQYNLVFDWQRRYSSWIGGSMIGSLSTFQNLAIPYKEHSMNDIIKRIL